MVLHDFILPPKNSSLNFTYTFCILSHFRLLSTSLSTIIDPQLISADATFIFLDYTLYRPAILQLSNIFLFFHLFSFCLLHCFLLISVRAWVAQISGNNMPPFVRLSNITSFNVVFKYLKLSVISVMFWLIENLFWPQRKKEANYTRVSRNRNLSQKPKSFRPG